MRSFLDSQRIGQPGILQRTSYPNLQSAILVLNIRHLDTE